MRSEDRWSNVWTSRSFAILYALPFLVRGYLPVPALAQDGAVVRVDTVEELYTEFYDPDNSGATIELAAGTYVLNAAGPNGGRLVFGPLTAKAIEGQNEYSDIDGDGVPDPRDDNGDGEPDLDAAGKKVFADPATETILTAAGLMLTPTNTFGFIELRAQPNSIGTSQSVSNITLRGNNRPRAAIIAQGTENSTLEAKVKGCLIEDAPRGIQVDARRMNPAGQNSQVHAVVEGNIIRNSGANNLPGVYFGWGIQAQQTNTSGVDFSLFVRRNRLYRNKVGLFLEASGMEDGVTDVVSQSNIYEEAVLTPNLDPSIGHVFSAGIFISILDFPMTSRGSSRNRVHLISNDDAILNNEGWAGLYVEGVHRQSNGTALMDNEIDVELVGTRFVKLNADGTFDGPQNREARVDPGSTVEEQPLLRRDITIVGANNSGTNLREPPPGGLNGPASRNRVDFLLRQATSSLGPSDYDGAPEPLLIEDAAPDQVKITILGSPTAFARTNAGFNLPDESLFESEGRE